MVSKSERLSADNDIISPRNSDDKPGKRSSLIRKLSSMALKVESFLLVEFLRKVNMSAP